MNEVYITRNVSYLPQPNSVTIVLSRIETSPALTKAAFLLPMFEDGSFLFAHNQRRGHEVPGGHVEPGETLLGAARREAFEEACVVTWDVIPLGFLSMWSRGKPPEDYAYPHPQSYQQFYCGRVSEQLPYRPNDECFEPVRRFDLTGLPPQVQIFCEAARELLT